MPSDVSTSLTVYHAVWSATNDQDDIKWYKVDNNGKTTATYTGDYGTYLIHTYAVIKGQMTCISATSINVPKPEVTVTITKLSETSAKVTVIAVPVRTIKMISNGIKLLNNQTVATLTLSMPKIITLNQGIIMFMFMEQAPLPILSLD